MHQTLQSSQLVPENMGTTSAQRAREIVIYFIAMGWRRLLRRRPVAGENGSQRSESGGGDHSENGSISNARPPTVQYRRGRGGGAFISAFVMDQIPRPLLHFWGKYPSSYALRHLYYYYYYYVYCLDVLCAKKCDLQFPPSPVGVVLAWCR